MPAATSRYLPTTPAQPAEMLRAMGVGDLEGLLDRIPSKARLDRDLGVPAPLAESELTAALRALAGENAHAGDSVSFMGGGAYDHFVPSVVNHLLLRGEF